MFPSPHPSVTLRKHSALFKNGVRDAIQGSVCSNFTQRLVTNTRSWNCAGHPLFCDSAPAGPVRVLRPSCSVVRHSTHRFLPPPRLTQSFSQFHPSDHFLFLLTLLSFSPPPSVLHHHPLTHLPTRPSNHPPTLHPAPCHPNEPRVALGIYRTALGRPGLCEHPSPRSRLHDVHWAAIRGVSDGWTRHFVCNQTQ